MADRRYIVSLLHDSRGIRELTALSYEGTITRLRNDIGQATLQITNDPGAHDLLNRIVVFATHIRCEEYSEDDPYNRINVFEGPVISVLPSDSGVNIIAGDLGAYWPKIPVDPSSYRDQDTAFLAEDFLAANLAKNPNALPVFNVFRSGYLDGIDVEAGERKFVSDIMQGFPGLTYTFVCRNLFLFGPDTQPKPALRFDDDSWMLPLIPEQSGAMYANAVRVVGKDVEGYVEQTNIDPRIGLLVRRFDLPEITQQSVANEAARSYLKQISNPSFLGGGPLTLNPSLDVDTNDLICGVYVEVKTALTGDERSQKMLLDSVTINMATGDRSVGLQPLGVIDG